ncbi:MAG TPA: hypothetical protein VGC31_03565 [Paenirhodobacter sp.]
MDRLTDPETLLDLACWLEAASLSSIEIEHEGTRIVVRVGAAAEVACAQAATAVFAPIAGQMLNTHPMRTVATDVAAGEAVAFVRIGPILVPVPAPQAGHVTDRTAPDGVLVGHGDILLSLEAK